MWQMPDHRAPHAQLIIDAVVHKKMIREGKLNDGFAQRRVTEYIDILQCKKCWRFGHLKRTCTFPACCKTCAGDHTTEECTLPESKPICANCVRHNSNSTSTISTAHSVAADNCPIRMNRIERLKIHFRTPQRKLVSYRN